VTTRIALDAMGGDHGPQSAIPGAALSLAKNPSLFFLIFGDERKIAPLLETHPDLKSKSRIVHTELAIRSDEKPSVALRASKGTSMRMAIEAVAEKQADAIVSSGNTGALMALARMVLKPIEGIHRPALVSVFPAIDGKTVMLDLGANVLVDAEHLVQFAVMGAVFAKLIKNVERPTVGLLNVGSEDMKGPDHVRAAAAVLAQIEFPGIYKGFVEGNDITLGTVDVVVSDGYVGNISLKAIEGVGKMANVFFKKYMSATPLAMLGALLAYSSLKKMKQKMDPRLYNGGVFLGLNGICVKSHGGSDALGFSTAVNMAADLASRGYIEKITADIHSLMAQESFIALAPV
jgi:glycerol-3-phosphate acyltransferase PlsX